MATANTTQSAPKTAVATAEVGAKQMTAEQRVAAARAAAVQAATVKAQAAKAKADMEKALEDMRQRALEAERKVREAAEAEALAQQRIRDAERQITSPPIDAAEARAVAERLIAGFDAYKNRHRDDFDAVNEAGRMPSRKVKQEAKNTLRTNEQLAAELWNVIDDTVARTLTPDVAEDARPIVLAIEGVLEAAAEWERDRLKEFRPATEEVLRELGKTYDPRLQVSPADSPLVIKLLEELNNVLTGQLPRKVEGVGELIAQNIAPAQICKMLGMQTSDGAGDLGILGFLIDRALGRAGYFNEVAGIAHLTRMGALNQDDAWKMRENSLQRRKDRAWEAGRPGSIQQAGQSRPGRAARSQIDHAAGTFENHDTGLSPAFQQSLKEIADRRRAKAAAGDPAA